MMSILYRLGRTNDKASISHSYTTLPENTWLFGVTGTIEALFFLQTSLMSYYTRVLLPRSFTAPSYSMVAPRHSIEAVTQQVLAN